MSWPRCSRCTGSSPSCGRSGVAAGRLEAPAARSACEASAASMRSRRSMISCESSARRRLGAFEVLLPARARDEGAGDRRRDHRDEADPEQHHGRRQDLAGVGLGDVVAVADRRHRLHRPPHARAEGRESRVVDDRHQPAGEQRDRRRHGRDHDRGLARVDGVLDQPVEPAFEACLVAHHVEVRTRDGQSCRGRSPELTRSARIG